jgi:hypothetical protein
MNESWSDGIVSFICNYWWVLLVLIVLVLVAYFTRDFWLIYLL